MILTLVVTTIREISSPEESLQDDRPIMTPIAFRHFPSTFEMARKRLRAGKRSTPTQSGEFPAFVELLLHHSRTSPCIYVPDLNTNKGAILHRKRQELEKRFELTPLAKIHRANTPFYLHYELGEDIRASRKTTNGPRLIYLTNATLIVVPVNLLSQWDREITKHCEYPLRVFIFRAGTPTPSAKSLASDYDVRISEPFPEPF